MLAKRVVLKIVISASCSTLPQKQTKKAKHRTSLCFKTFLIFPLFQTTRFSCLPRGWTFTRCSPACWLCPGRLVGRRGTCHVPAPGRSPLPCAPRDTPDGPCLPRGETLTACPGSAISICPWRGRQDQTRLLMREVQWELLTSGAPWTWTAPKIPRECFFSVILPLSSPLMTSTILIEKDRDAIHPSTFAKMPVSELCH